MGSAIVGCAFIVVADGEASFTGCVKEVGGVATTVAEEGGGVEEA